MQKESYNQSNNMTFHKIMEAAPKTEPERQYYFMDQVRALVSEKKRVFGHANCLVSVMGCQMSAKDAEKMTGILERCGYTPVEDESEADIVLFSTCTVRENANQKLYGRVGQLKHQKRQNPDLIVGITGCMMQEKDEVETIQKKYPYVSLIFGTHNVYKLAELLFEKLYTERKRVVEVWEEADGIVENLPSDRKYSFKAGVNISYGCNNFCTYCIVPYVRGRERSRNADDIVAEIEALVADGVVEVMLLGQNVNSYGHDLGDSVTFPALLRRVEKIEGLRRIRFMTPHPKDFSDELIEVMANSTKICRQLHLPMQSGSTEVLRRMNRRYTKEDYLALVRKIRARIPDVGLTTDIIVGFPGETEADFADTLAVVKEAAYDSAFTFIYSKRTGTPAADFPDQVPEDVVNERFNRLLAAVAESSKAHAGRDEGKVMEVLVEEEDAGKEGYLTGRLSNNMLVHFPGDVSLIGKLILVKLSEAKGFYYLGEQV